MPSRRAPAGLPPQLTSLRRTVVMAVLNVTPDSFSDGGAFLSRDQAVARARRQVRAGSRPDRRRWRVDAARSGADTGSAELDRVLPVVRTLSAEGVAVSIDTMRAEVARAAVAAGAVLVNDVSGGLADEAMLPFVAEAGLPVVLMHWRGHSREMQERASYPGGVVKEVVAELAARLDAAVAAGCRGRVVARSRAGLCEGGRAQLGSAAVARCVDRARTAGSGRGITQTLSRGAAG